jgi:predicted site-specific integrase-resolvase
MGRPLKGSIRHHQNRWWGSLPAERGSNRRREEAFLTEAEARAWLDQAIAALGAGEAMPNPDRFRRRKTSTPKTPAPDVRLQGDIASVCKAWTVAAYDDLRRAGPERADQIRHLIETYLVPWFAPRTQSVTDITYFMAHDWLLWLVGREKGQTPSGTVRPSHRDVSSIGRGEVGLAEAAEICRVSLPTVRRRWQDGLLPGAYRNDHGQVRVPEQALAKIRSKREHQPVALSQAVVSEALWILRRVLAFARANGLLTPGFDPTEGLEAPSPDPAKVRRRQPTRQPRPLTLPECRRIAAHLHPVHQTAFWLQRIMGLRISESFGVLVGDVVDLGDSALLAIQGQGGRSFSVRDEHGIVVAVPYKATTKTAAGSRVLVLPKAMAELIKVGVEAFHTDPADGTVATEARLVPGLQAADEGGQLGFRQAFEDAAIKEQLSADDLGFTVSPHLLRKSLATDLAWETGIEDTVRRRFMGHRAGDDVFGRIYTLDHPEVTPLVKVAAALDRQIEASIGSLLAPTTTKMKWGRANPITGRLAHVTATLSAAGWLVDPGGTDDPLCNAKRVADELEIVETTARRWMADGTLHSVLAPDGQAVPRRYSRLSDVWALRDQLAGRLLLPQLAEELGLRYHELYGSVRRLGLELEQHPTSREFVVHDEAAQILRAEHQRIRALHQRSMKAAAAAQRLKVAESTARVLIKRGQLDLDPETDSSGARFVTRASVERYWSERGGVPLAYHEAAAAVPIAEVARFTGASTSELMDLVRQGVLEQIPGRRRCELTATSLRSWMSSNQRESA